MSGLLQVARSPKPWYGRHALTYLEVSVRKRTQLQGDIVACGDGAAG